MNFSKRIMISLALVIIGIFGMYFTTHHTELGVGMVFFGTQILWKAPLELIKEIPLEASSFYASFILAVVGIINAIISFLKR